MRCRAAAIHDHVRGETTLIAEDDAGWIARMRDDLARATPADATPPRLAELLEEDPPQRFLDGVARIQRYLRDGDVFQVNLSRAWRAALAPGVSATGKGPGAGARSSPGSTCAASS